MFIGFRHSTLTAKKWRKVVGIDRQFSKPLTHGGSISIETRSRSSMLRLHFKFMGTWKCAIRPQIVRDFNLALRPGTFEDTTPSLSSPSYGKSRLLADLGVVLF